MFARYETQNGANLDGLVLKGFQVGRVCQFKQSDGGNFSVQGWMNATCGCFVCHSELLCPACEFVWLL